MTMANQRSGAGLSAPSAFPRGTTHMRLQEYDTSVRFAARVVASERITPESTYEVREIQLDIPQPGFTAAAGQSVGVLAPGQKEFGQQHHFRLYTVADLPEPRDGHVRIKLCVRRCSYVDEYSGEEYLGRASNYLCDLRPGDTVTLTGPYGLAFAVPADPDATLILIGMGTGIAPFRAFVRHLAQNAPEFRGKVWLFHGARTGLDLLYHNDPRGDLTQYYDRGTFEAIQVLSSRPHWTDEIDWGSALRSHGRELARLLDDARTHVYVAGLEKIRDQLDRVFAELAGGPARWARRKSELVAGGRWVELLY